MKGSNCLFVKREWASLKCFLKSNEDKMGKLIHNLIYKKDYECIQIMIPNGQLNANLGIQSVGFK